METPQPASAPVEEPKSSIVLMIEQLYAKRHEIRTLLLATIDDKARADAGWSTPVNAPGLSHLMRMLNVKLDRYYQRGMYPAAPQPPGPVAGVKSNTAGAQVSRAVRRAIEKRQKKVHKADRKVAAQGASGSKPNGGNHG